MKNSLPVMLLVMLMSGSCQSVQQPDGKAADDTCVIWDSTRMTNDFFDDEPSCLLTGPSIIEVSGEVAGIVKVDLDSLPQRTVIVKETALEEGEVGFIGAYRYDGISLYDILNHVKVAKKNAEEFAPVIDQYVVVYGADGDSVVISWGEIFYPVIPHQILIARQVMRIVPSKTLDQWPLPEKSRLVVGLDLVTERNLSEPSGISIRSIGVSYPVDRTVKMWSPEMVLAGISDESLIISKLPADVPALQLDQVFYGRGRGIHGITRFQGAGLKDLLIHELPLTAERIRTGLFTIAAVDGYRCAMTYSELMNRNDHAAVIIMDESESGRDGRFSCIFGGDFFSDRAVKSITEIRLIH